VKETNASIETKSKEDPLGRPRDLTSSDSVAKTAKVANGCLAMLEIIGRIFQGGLTGSAWGNQALYTAWPLLAFVNELGVQPQIGFWDPARFAANGSQDQRGRKGAAARAREEADPLSPSARRSRSNPGHLPPKRT
jgi:hypothetical protein